MIVIGADTHKRTHALAAVDDGTGRLRGAREVQANEAGHFDALRWAGSLDEDRVWAIEDCRHVSRRLEQALIAVGERVVRVAPHRMAHHVAASASPASPTRSTRRRSPERSSKTASTPSRPRTSMRTRCRSGCCQITAAISSPSARECKTGCAGISSRSPLSSRRQ
jgi:transposase